MLAKGFEILEYSVIQMGPFVKVQIHVESQSQSSTPPLGTDSKLNQNTVLQAKSGSTSI